MTSPDSIASSSFSWIRNIFAMVFGSMPFVVRAERIAAPIPCGSRACPEGSKNGGVVVGVAVFAMMISPRFADSGLLVVGALLRGAGGGRGGPIGATGAGAITD